MYSALFAVPATDGVDGLTRMLWEECARVGMPRAVVITKIDHQRADFDAALAACRDAFGESVAPLYLPVSDGEGSGARGLIGLLSQKLFDYSGSARAEALHAPEPVKPVDAAIGADQKFTWPVRMPIQRPDACLAIETG